MLWTKVMRMRAFAAAKGGGAPPGVKRRSARATARAFLKALLRDDRASAIAIAESELRYLGSRAAVFADLLHPAQYQIGELWYEGEIGIADEHRATGIVEAIVDKLPPVIATQPEELGTCVVAVVGADEHGMGLRMLTAALSDDGWSVQVVPRPATPERVVEVVKRARPRLVCISAGYLPDPGQVEATVRAVKALGVPVLVGGAAFNRAPHLAARVGADAHGQDVRVALALARRLARK